ncbi:MAG: YncE family protein [Acidobacteriota bacterium]
MRILLCGVLSGLGVIAFAGCGGSSFHGTVGGGGGTSPQPSAGEPQVTAVSPSTVVAGGPSFTLTVTGQNFAQGDTVEWGSAALTSTFVSSTQMTAQVPDQLLYEAGTVTIIVQTPTPNALNFGTTLTVTAAPAPGTAGFTVSTVNVEANDIVWDATSQQLYVSIAGSNPSNPNTVAALNPITAQFGATGNAGPGANQLAVSSDGSWLYAGIDKNNAVQRFALPGLANDISISLGSGTHAFALAPDPVSSNTIAVSQGTTANQPGEVVVYDGATARSATVSNFGGYPEPIGSLVWNPSGASLYAAFNQIYMDDVYVLSVNSSGVQLAQSDSLNTSSTGQTLGGIQYSASTGYLYGGDGAVIDPASGKQVNQFSLNASADFSGYYFTPLLTIDDNLGIAWLMAPSLSGSGGQYVIQAFDLKSCALLGAIAISNVKDNPVKLIRWGSDGLAFLTNAGGGPQAGDGVYIVSGAFVTNPSTQLRLAAGRLN